MLGREEHFVFWEGKRNQKEKEEIFDICLVGYVFHRYLTVLQLSYFFGRVDLQTIQIVCVRVTKRKDYKMISWKGWVTVKGMRGRIMLFFMNLEVDI